MCISHCGISVTPTILASVLSIAISSCNEASFLLPPSDINKQFLLDSNLTELNWIWISWSLLVRLECWAVVAELSFVTNANQTSVTILQRVLLHTVFAGFCCQLPMLPHSDCQ